MNIDMKLEGFNKVFKSMDKFGKDQEKRVDKALKATALEIETQTKRKLQAAPFITRTGTLASSYQSQKVRKGYLVGSRGQSHTGDEVLYAGWIEFGKMFNSKLGKMIFRKTTAGKNAFFSSVNKALVKLKNRL